MLTVLSFFIQGQRRYIRAWPKSSCRSGQPTLVSGGSFSRSKAEGLVQPTILAPRQLEPRLVQGLHSGGREFAARFEKLFHAFLDFQPPSAQFGSAVFAHGRVLRPVAIGRVTLSEITELSTSLEQPEIPLMLLAARLVRLPSAHIDQRLPP